MSSQTALFQSYEIKSATLPLMAVILKTNEVSVLAADLAAKLGETPDFFNDDPVVIDITAVDAAAFDIDFVQVCKTLKNYRLNPVAVRGSQAHHQSRMQDAGLFEASDLILQSPHASKAPKVAPKEVIIQEVIREVEVVRAEPAVREPALVIERPLRSGQHVYAKGRDLVVMAMVNPGAEIFADGHIHVYAPLRGKAIAGANGNEQARIFTSCLEAELISIAGIFRTSEKPLPADVAGKPAQISLQDEKLVFQPL